MEVHFIHNGGGGRRGRRLMNKKGLSRGACIKQKDVWVMKQKLLGNTTGGGGGASSCRGGTQLSLKKMDA